MGLTFDALSFWYDGRLFVMLAEDKDNYFRSRFDAAHELAHLVLHPSIDCSKDSHRTGGRSVCIRLPYAQRILHG